VNRVFVAMGAELAQLDPLSGIPPIFGGGVSTDTR
jgi:hypothetical protein